LSVGLREFMSANCSLAAAGDADARTITARNGSMRERRIDSLIGAPT
jgi:hypothetical protein